MKLEQIQESQGLTLNGYYYQIQNIDEYAEEIHVICTDNQGIMSSHLMN
ncbi:hypothetical protein [Thalassotalea piscium]|uniref:Uncharacterized protein n=1 Tax=Thalassotalea piscium TaxID=1230533 RepID=A0A7X0NJ62_9GAMM|nr:hypothetical protein [Thalassotalea piscium]MBB6544385.1 hypothetical protein [Thalassotalea piscium]